MAAVNDDTHAARPRRLRSLLVVVIGAALFALVRMMAAPHARPVQCGRDLAPGPDTVVMLSASWCRYCAGARDFLAAKKISYCEYDIEQSTEGAARYAKAKLGVIPIIYVRDEVLVGFDQNELQQTLNKKLGTATVLN